MTAAFGDWLAIVDLKARYCRLLDTKDWAGFAALLDPDVVIDTTAAGGPLLTGRDVAVASIRASLATAASAHHVHNPEIGVDGDTASAIWAMQDRLAWPDGRMLSGAGHYHERYARSGNGWRIVASRLTRLYATVAPVSG